MNYNKLTFIFIFMIFAVTITAAEETKLGHISKLIKSANYKEVQIQLTEQEFSYEDLQQLHALAIKENVVDKSWGYTLLSYVGISASLFMIGTHVVSINALKRRLETAINEDQIFDLLAGMCRSSVWLLVDGTILYNFISNWNNSGKIVELINNKLKAIYNKSAQIV